MHLRTSPRLQREWTLRRPCAPASRVSKPSRACRIGNSSWSRRGTDTGNSSPFPRSPCGAPHGCASRATVGARLTALVVDRFRALLQTAGSTALETDIATINEVHPHKPPVYLGRVYSDTTGDHRTSWDLLPRLNGGEPRRQCAVWVYKHKLPARQCQQTFG